MFEHCVEKVAGHFAVQGHHVGVKQLLWTYDRKGESVS